MGSHAYHCDSLHLLEISVHRFKVTISPSTVLVFVPSVLCRGWRWSRKSLLLFLCLFLFPLSAYSPGKDMGGGIWDSRGGRYDQICPSGGMRGKVPASFSICRHVWSASLNQGASKLNSSETTVWPKILHIPSPPLPCRIGPEPENLHLWTTEGECPKRRPHVH